MRMFVADEVAYEAAESYATLFEVEVCPAGKGQGGKTPAPAIHQSR